MSRLESVRSALWWAIGAVVVAAVPVAAVWTLNRGNGFWSGIATAALGGAILGVRRRATPRSWPGSVVFAVAYPVALASGISWQAWEDDGRFGAGALLGWAVALTLSGLPVIGATRSSTLWFRWWVVAWGLMSLALFFAYGLGLGFVPLAVSAGLSARTYRLAADGASPELRPV